MGAVGTRFSPFAKGPGCRAFSLRPSVPPSHNLALPRVDKAVSRKISHPYTLKLNLLESGYSHFRKLISGAPSQTAGTRHQTRHETRSRGNKDRFCRPAREKKTHARIGSARGRRIPLGGLDSKWPPDWHCSRQTDVGEGCRRPRRSRRRCHAKEERRTVYAQCLSGCSAEPPLREEVTA